MYIWMYRQQSQSFQKDCLVLIIKNDKLSLIPCQAKYRNARLASDLLDYHVYNLLINGSRSEDSSFTSLVGLDNDFVLSKNRYLRL